MIEILKITPDEIKILDDFEDDCWVHLQAPTEKDIDKLREVVDVPNEVLTSLRDVDEIPTVEEYKDFIFLIIRTPYNHPKSEYTWITHPLGIILHKKLVVTICFDPNDAVDRLKSRKFDFKKSQLVLRLLLTTSKMFLEYLKILHKKMIQHQEEIEGSHKNKVIMNFLELENSLVYFDTSIKSNQILIERISKDKRLLKHKENTKYIHQIIEENRQAIQMTEVYSNILSNTLDSFASIISNNLNTVMKTLTSLTLVFSIPTLIASIYGMNVELPYGHTPNAFFFVMSISTLLAGGAIIVFARKKFF